MTALILTVNGTGSPDPFGPGFSGALGSALVAGEDPAWDGVWKELTGQDPVWVWQPVGYPAATFPMGPSVVAGVNEVVRLLTEVHPTGPFAMSGYSQGAIVTGKVWRDEILNPNGRLHHRLGDIFAIINYGDPMRAPGIANGNEYAGQPLPKPVDGFTTGGIAGPDALTPEETPPWLLSFANDGDLYASCPIGDSPKTAEAPPGRVETLVYNLVQNASLTNILDIAEEVAKALVTPVSEVVPIVEALLNGGMFVASGFGPHGAYDINAAFNYLQQRVQSLQPTVRVAAADAPTVAMPTVVPHEPNGAPKLWERVVTVVVDVVRKLPTIRKEAVAGLTSAAAVAGAVEALTPHANTPLTAALATAGGCITTLLALLTSNRVEEVVEEVSKL